LGAALASHVRGLHLFSLLPAHVATVGRAAAGQQVSPVQHYEGADRVDGRGGRWNSFVFFDDPDGNAWAIGPDGRL
jgi:hypothetical protein